MNLFEKFAAHIVFFIIFFLLLINLGLILKIHINHFSLPIIYIVYTILFVVYKTLKKQNLTKRHFLTITLTPLIFALAIFYFGKTFDSSFDGQDYHSSGVIALKNGWNPFYERELPIKLPNSKPYVIGYPKSLWLLQSAIYSYTNNLNSATITNLIILLPSTILVFGALRKLKLSRAKALIITILAVLEPNYIQEFFTYMADGFSYQVALISISSLVYIYKNINFRLYFTIFIFSLLLLAGTKFSNLPLFITLSIIGLSLSYKRISKNIKSIILMEILFILSIFILWIPYFQNLTIESTPIYPSNLEFAQKDLFEQNLPQNLKHANRFQQLFYGIFSEGQKIISFDSPDNIANLKIPFTTNIQEILVTNNWNGRVASEGVLFSGIFTISIFFIIFITLNYKKLNLNRKNIILINSLILIMLVPALAEPTPNILRLSPTIYLIPVITLITTYKIITIKKQNISGFASILIILMFINLFLKFIPTLAARDHEMKAQNYLLKKLKDTQKTYPVHARSFYSSYVLLEQNGVKFKRTEILPCKNPPNLWIFFNTYYCEL